MIVAWTALMIWPLLAVIFFAVMSLPAALVTTIVGGYVLLPERVRLDLPVLPSLDKDTIPALVAVLAAAIVAGKTTTPVLKGHIPRHPVVLGLLVVLFLGVAGTVLTNGEPLFFQNQFLPGLRLWDLLASSLTLIMMLLPFVLGRKYLASEEAQLTALKTFVIIALGYSLFALIEIRLSPQMNLWVYGFFPHNFSQHIRGGGYRPLVFLNHGLWLAIFFTTATLAAAGLAKTVKEKQQKAFFLLVALWLFATLALSRSLGALLIAVVFLFLLIQPQKLIRIGLIFVISIVFFYPLLRTMDAVPVEAMVNLISQISVDRAGSLEFRLINEKFILEHGQQKPIFGWGPWDRNLAVALENGRQVIPDGRWTLAFGVGGYVRFIAEFGLLCIGALGLVFGHRSIPLVSLSVAVLLTANLLDLLPNATLTPVTWLWAGALAGRLELRENVAMKTAVSQDQDLDRPSTRPVYSRAISEHSPYRRNQNETNGRK